MRATVFADGAPLALGARLGKGGEGEVYALADTPDLAVKLYDSAGAARREPKIRAMVAAEIGHDIHHERGVVAFPRAAVQDAGGRFAGFLMPRVQNAAPLHELYAPGPRKEHFPQADFRFLVRAARNIARAVAVTHDAGCVIGDINHSGILVTNDARVTLIDADSFQIHDGETLHPCHVGVPEYTPPELSGRSLSTAVRTRNHDAFGLAVVVFQLLFMGRHPFAGVAAAGTVSVPDAIAGFRFAWSSRETGLSPPAGAARLDDLPPQVAQAFEAAFSPDGVTARPSAAEWVDTLSMLEEALVPCAASLRHHHADSAAGCPWCRAEGASGSILFLLPEAAFAQATDGSGATALPPFDAASILSRIRGVSLPERVVYAPPDPPGDPPAPPERSPFAQVPRLLGGVAMLAIGTVNVVLIPQNWLMSTPAIAAGAVWVRDGFRRERPAVQDLVAVDSRLSRAFLDAARQIDLDGPTLLKAELEGLIDARRALPVRLAEAERDVQASSADRQRNAYLARLTIAQAAFPGSSADLTARLREAGIATAADLAAVSTARVSRITAEEATSLRNWLSGVIGRFRPDPALGPQERAELGRRRDAEIARARAIDQRIDETLRQLEAGADAIETARRARDPGVEALLLQREALVREIEAFGKTAPPLPGQPARSVRAETRQRAAALRKNPGI